MPTLKMNDIKPLAGYVVVEPVETQQQTEAGIFLPQTNEEKPQMGTVRAVSKSYTNESGAEIKCPVKKGDVVIYKKWGGNEIKVSSKEVQVLKYEDLIAVVKNK